MEPKDVKIKVVSGNDYFGVRKNAFVVMHGNEKGKIHFDELEGLFEISEYIWEPPQNAKLSFLDRESNVGFTIEISCDKDLNSNIMKMNPTLIKVVEPQLDEIKSSSSDMVSADQKKKFKIIGISIGAVAILAILVGVFYVKANEKTKYIEAIKNAQELMLEGGAKAETLCNLTHSVWYNSIYEKYDSTTNKYTQDANGRYNDDFNTSLSNLYTDPNILAIIEEIEYNQEVVAKHMREIQNPPETLAQCYSTIDSMYEAYYELTSLAISPSGNLNSYASDFRTCDSDFIKYYDKLNTLLPEE